MFAFQATAFVFYEKITIYYSRSLVPGTWPYRDHTYFSILFRYGGTFRVTGNCRCAGLLDRRVLGIAGFFHANGPDPVAGLYAGTFSAP